MKFLIANLLKSFQLLLQEGLMSEFHSLNVHRKPLMILKYHAIGLPAKCTCTLYSTYILADFSFIQWGVDTWEKPPNDKERIRDSLGSFQWAFQKQEVNLYRRAKRFYLKSAVCELKLIWVTEHWAGKKKIKIVDIMLNKWVHPLTPLLVKGTEYRRESSVLLVSCTFIL
jgi:hypothetical protein